MNDVLSTIKKNEVVRLEFVDEVYFPEEDERDDLLFVNRSGLKSKLILQQSSNKRSGVFNSINELSSFRFIRDKDGEIHIINYLTNEFVSDFVRKSILEFVNNNNVSINFKIDKDDIKAYLLHSNKYVVEYDKTFFIRFAMGVYYMSLLYHKYPVYRDALIETDVLGILKSNIDIVRGRFVDIKDSKFNYAILKLIYGKSETYAISYKVTFGKILNKPYKIPVKHDHITDGVNDLFEHTGFNKRNFLYKVRERLIGVDGVKLFDDLMLYVIELESKVNGSAKNQLDILKADLINSGIEFGELFINSLNEAKTGSRIFF